MIKLTGDTNLEQRESKSPLILRHLLKKNIKFYLSLSNNAILLQRAEELRQRMDMIEEIRALSQLKEYHGCPFDPSETMNFGLLCEMSLTEVKQSLLCVKQVSFIH